MEHFAWIWWMSARVEEKEENVTISWKTKLSTYSAMGASVKEDDHNSRKLQTQVYGVSESQLLVYSTTGC